MQAIDRQQLQRFHQDLHQQPAAAIKGALVQNNGFNKATQNQAQLHQLNPEFNVEVATGKVSNQKKSGRCWLFSTLTTLRTKFATKYQIKDFELSQNYLSFYDRLEKANVFYQQVLATADRKLTDRYVAQLLAGPDEDGGRWNYGYNLVQKYGVVPKYVMPETYNSEHTQEFSQVLNTKLRKDAIQLRSLVKQQATSEQLQQTVQTMLSEVYRICVLCFGQPPVKFDLELKTDQGQLIQEAQLTPQQFATKYCAYPFADYVSLLNAPQASKPYGRTYHLKDDTNMVGTKQQKDLNLPIERLKQITIQQLQAGDTVWFGNDVSAQSNRQQGLLAGDLYQYQELLAIDLTMTKEQRLETRQAQMSHAMVLTGVDLNEQGQARKWKVENSWGEQVGTKGYFVMDDQWFSDYVYEIIVQKEFLTPVEQQQWQQDPILVPAWDPLA